MRKSKFQLYLPFIALALAQAAFVVWAPSQGESNDPLSQLATGAPTQGFTPGGGTVLDSSGRPVTTGNGVTTGGSIGGSTGVGSSTGSGGVTGGGQVVGGTGAGGVIAGDTSHCTENGRQSDLIATAPACKPRFAGDNGGATYPGVTGETVKYIRFSCQSNEQVSAILATQGLAASEEETDEMIAATMEWMKATYEFYGREIAYERYIGDCPSAPGDPAKSRQAAAEVVQKQPFVVTGGDPSALDTFTQAGIISLGGTGHSDEFFTGRRPFRWDIFPDGTESVDWLSEYYCKKLAGGNATNAGQVIHPEIGTRATKRKVGVISFDNNDGTTTGYTQALVDQLEACTGQESVPVAWYASDINRATEQTRATVAKLISEKITTVICLCDPIAPVFLTSGLTQNNYYPEHLLSGMYLTDYDVLGRLYDQAQWAHAFGPSHLASPTELSNSNAGRIWTASGREGTPCDACNLITGYMTMIGSMIHYAGPNLNPLTVEQHLVGDRAVTGGWAATGGNPYDYFIAFGPGDYNAISDFREAYWSTTAPSEVDGKAGAYIPMNGGRRYIGGELDSTFEIPPSAQ